MKLKEIVLFIALIINIFGYLNLATIFTNERFNDTSFTHYRLRLDVAFGQCSAAG